MTRVQFFISNKCQLNYTLSTSILTLDSRLSHFSALWFFQDKYGVHLHTQHTSGERHYHGYTVYCISLMYGIMWQPSARPGMADGCPTANVLTTTLSLMPIPAVPSTKGKWDRITTTGLRPFRQQYAASAKHSLKRNTSLTRQGSLLFSTNAFLWFTFTFLVAFPTLMFCVALICLL